MSVALTLIPESTHGVQYDLSPVSCVVTASGDSPVLLEWRVDDWRGNLIAVGTIAHVGSGATQIVQFVPPSLGSYILTVSAIYGGMRAASAAMLLSVTTDGDRLPDQFDDTELELIAWGRMGLARLNTDQGLDALATRIAIAERLQLSWIVQFVSAAQATPDICTAAATRFRGVTWEVVNEPSTPDGAVSIGADYVSNVLAPAYKALKAADPTCSVLGPNPVDADAGPLSSFVAAGGLNFTDGFAVHDYQGHEQIDPFEWRSLLGLIRDELASGGKPNLPVWVTERAISAYRLNMLTATVQAVWLLRHVNLLDAGGVPISRNAYYYANDIGYHAVPSWLYGLEGCMPGLLMLRFRGQLLGSATFQRELDFGTVLNRCLHGPLHADGNRQIVTLYNFGCGQERVTLNVNPNTTISLYDAFGNALPTPKPQSNGNLTVTTSEVPTYLVLPAGASVNMVQEAWGTNLAVGAQAKSSAATIAGWGDLSVITNGNILPIQGDDLFQPFVWAGDATTLPQTVDITLPAPQSVTRMIVWGESADNTFCALLGYDLQAMVNGQWQTIDSYDDIVPAKWSGPTPYTDFPHEYVQTYAGRNFAIHRFPSVNASQFRLSVRRASYGLSTDDAANADGPTCPRYVCLRQVELYA